MGWRGEGTGVGEGGCGGVGDGGCGGVGCLSLGVG